MATIVIVEPSFRQSDAQPIVLESAVWKALCDLGRQQGYHVTNETTISPLDGRLLAGSIRRGMQQQDVRPGRGSDRFTASMPSILNQADIREKVHAVLFLLENGVVLTRRTV